MLRTIIQSLPPVVLGFALLSSCAGDDESAIQSQSPSPVTHAGGEPPIYDEPRLLVPGEYLSPAFEADAAERGQAAEAEDRSKGVLRGEVNGVLLVEGPSEYHTARDVCGPDNISGYIEDDMLVLQYLPKGTWATRPQVSEQCPDESISSTGQEFQTLNTTFGIWFYFGPRVLAHNASADRVRTEEINGTPAVVVEPVIAEGFGQSWIALPAADGLLVVNAWGLPLEETLAIARGVKCDICWD